MARGGRQKSDNTSLRRCIVTRAELPKSDLIRFVVGPDADIVPDLAEKLPGRGIWVSALAGAVETAAKRGHFNRAAKMRVRATPGLAVQVEDLLVRKLTDLMALARKAGQAVAGREKTLAALSTGEAELLVQAKDGSLRERSGLRPPKGEDSRVTCLLGHELGMAFGRDRVIHAAVLAGGLADRIGNEARRLRGFRAEADQQRPSDGAGDVLAEEGLRGKG